MRGYWGATWKSDEDQYYALLNIGIGYSLLGDNREPIIYHLEALTLAQELNDENKLANIYNELGIDYQNQQFAADLHNNITSTIDYRLQPFLPFELHLILTLNYQL